MTTIKHGELPGGQEDIKTTEETLLASQLLAFKRWIYGCHSVNLGKPRTTITEVTTLKTANHEQDLVFSYTK